MTIHYHGTPVTPRSELLTLGGKHFCVSFSDPRDAGCCHQIGQSVMLDNGAFSAWTKGKQVNWRDYYEWCEKWLEYATTWAVIPDVIDGADSDNDMLIARCPLSLHQSAPVWHLHESTNRLVRFLDFGYTRICFGSSGEYAQVGTDKWHRRVHEAFNRLSCEGPIPWIHMLRGMSLCGSHYPFASVDSTDVARNHKDSKRTAKAMADRWDAIQNPSGWVRCAEQRILL